MSVELGKASVKCQSSIKSETRRLKIRQIHLIFGLNIVNNMVNNLQGEQV